MLVKATFFAILSLFLALPLTTSFMMQPRTITVAPGQSVQEAINSANLGDTIILQAGAEYSLPLTLPLKSGTSFLTIQSSRAPELPTGVRVTPAQRSLLAKITSSAAAEPMVKTVPGAHHYRFVGIEFSTATPSTVVYDLIRWGGGRDTQKTLDQVPNFLEIVRSWVHGWDIQDVQRGLSLQCSNCGIIDSYVSDIHGVGFDTQAIAGWNGPGPIYAINNYLEGAGENILFGGADAASEAFTPNNISIIRNDVVKPLSWKVGDPSYAGKHWTVKNLLELKNAKNTAIIGNNFFNNWTDGQTGIPILFTVRNQECTNPFATIQNVKFSYNVIKNAEGVFNFLGKDNEAEPTYIDPQTGRPKCGDPGESFGSVRGNGFTSSHNLAYDIKGPFVTLNGYNGISLDRFTHLQQSNLTTVYGEPSYGFRYTNNLTFDHDYGFWTEKGIGLPGLTQMLPDAVIENNVIVNPYDRGAYPSNNTYLTSLTLPPDLRSPYPDKGADVDLIKEAQVGNVATPTPTPTPTPSPSPTSTPTPIPTPSPSPSPVPTPTPTPTPERCTISVPPLVTVPAWTTGVITVALVNNTGEVTVTAVSSSGQVKVESPKIGVGASALVPFRATVKKNGATVTFKSPCNTVSTQVVVR